MTLKQQAFSAVRWTAVAMVGRVGFSLLQVTILARLLERGDFGLVAIAASVIAFAQVFCDMGISNAIINRQSISHETLSSLFWLNIMASVLICLIVVIASRFVADWYGEPKLQLILGLVSSTFVISALAQQLRIVAEKELHFKNLAVIDISAASVGVVVAISVALAGGGVYALVAGTLTSSIISTALTWLLVSNGWRPLLRLRFDEIREYISFGAFMVGFSLTNTAIMQTDIFIGGRLLGASSLGAYSLPKDLNLRVAMLINPIVTRVGLPIMAKATNDKNFLKMVYLKTLRMTTSINFPVYIAFVFFAQEVVGLLFGGKWQESVPLLRILALWGLFRSIGNPAGSLVFAVGRADLAFKWSLALMVLFIPTCWMGAKYGQTGLALSLLCFMILIAIPMWLILIHPICGAGFGEYFKQIAVPGVISIVSCLTAYILASFSHEPILRLTIGGLVATLSYVLISRRFNTEWFTNMSQLLFRDKPTKGSSLLG